MVDNWTNNECINKNRKRPPRYETVHQLVAEKVKGVHMLDKLGKLKKYESEYNLILKTCSPIKQHTKPKHITC